MTAEIVDVNSCKRNLVVEVPNNEVDQEIDKLARKYAQNAKIPGFRPGKVPLNIIKQRFGNELRSDATQDIIQRSWKDAIETHHLHPLAEPTVENVEAKPDGPLKFTMVFEVLPAVELKDYKGLAVSVTEPSVEDADVDKALEELREQNAQYVPVEGEEVSDGHFVSLSVEGQSEGSKPVHEHDVTCVVGSPQTNETFSENLKGAKSGETRSFDVTYPEDYHRKRFAGKTVHYTVTIKEIKEKQLAEINDDFAKDVGHENLAELRAKIKDDLITKGRQTAEKKARETVLDEVVQRHTFDVPDCLVQSQLEEHARMIAGNLARQGIDASKISIDWRKIFDEERPRAEQSVRRSIVLDAVARQEGIEVTDQELDSELEKLTDGSNKSVAALKAQLEKEDRIQGFRERLRHNKALDFIYRNATISGG